jgi:phage FluMu protein Com
MARLPRWQKRRKGKRKTEPIYRCTECRGVLAQASEYDVEWRCVWCDHVEASVQEDGKSKPAAYWVG